VIVPIAYGIAVVATLLLIRHVARRYPAVPKRVPLRIGIDGRPSKRSGPKAVLWLAPGIIVAVLIVLGVALRLDPPEDHVQVVLALVFLILAEVAWYAGWLIDRQIELARKMTYRIAPMRALRVSLPILITITVVVVLAVRS
jgi:uncharacterized membrane protein